MTDIPPPPPPWSSGPWTPTPPPQWPTSPPPWGPPPLPPTQPRRTGFAATAAVVVIAVILAATVGVAVGRRMHRAFSSNPSTAQQFIAPNTQNNQSSGLSSSVQQIASNVEPGLVDIDTKLGYQGAAAAGTGMILSASGEVLTNNHVVSGATTITATVIDTGRTYTATVVGTDPTADVAVIQLKGASGLKPVKTNATAKPTIGDAVVAIGNAGGAGGAPSVVTGTVTALGQSITASNDDGSGAEQLSNLIETNAPIEPGDSGGPLVNASSEVIGIDTAASSSGRYFSRSLGYAIPIGDAVSVAQQIESGKGSDSIRIGTPGFLGVEISPNGGQNVSGAVIGGVPNGTPAAQAGLAAGDVITSVDGKSIGSATDLTTALHAHKPGDRVTIGWTDGSGSSHTATVTLISGPAD